eukprot:403351962
MEFFEMPRQLNGEPEKTTRKSDFLSQFKADSHFEINQTHPHLQKKSKRQVQVTKQCLQVPPQNRPLGCLYATQNGLDGVGCYCDGNDLCNNSVNLIIGLSSMVCVALISFIF